MSDEVKNEVVEENKKEDKFAKYDNETLVKQISVCKKLRLVFILVGALLALGGAVMAFFGFIYLLGGALAVVFTLGYGDISDLADMAGALLASGFVVHVAGLAMIIAGAIVTSVKIKRRNHALSERDYFTEER